MKKLLISVYLLSAVAIYGYAQSITLSNINGPIAPNATIIQQGTPDSVELITYLNVKNASGNSLSVFCKKVELIMLDSTEITMCWAGNCYPAATNISPYAQAISPGQINTEFVGHYTQTAFNHFKVGESVVRWVFYDRALTDDSASVTVKYTSFPLAVEETQPHQAVLSGIYPNPASGDVSCTYSLPGGAQGSILVRNMLGASVYTHPLLSSTGKVTFSTINLSDGIYFCSLLVDGKIRQTQKLIVKH